MTSSCMDGLTTCMQCWYNCVAVWNQISLINKMAHLANSLTFKYYNPLLWQIMAINMISHIIHGNITNFWSENITIQIYAPILDLFLIIFKFDGNFILLPCELQWSDCNKKNYEWHDRSGVVACAKCCSDMISCGELSIRNFEHAQTPQCIQWTSPSISWMIKRLPCTVSNKHSFS